MQRSEWSLNISYLRGSDSVNYERCPECDLILVDGRHCPGCSYVKPVEKKKSS